MPAADYPAHTVAVTTTATLIHTIGADSANVLVQNKGPAPVYLGGSTVTADSTSTGGWLLGPGQSVTLPDLNPGSGSTYVLYGITASDSAYVVWVAV